ncbi:C39 family peptidase, partial [Clostridium sp.]|uniref:C39 family peptidase n=1 Tax=Clostridium sp. TaxID=1506 RepID=UPI003F3074FF
MSNLKDLKRKRRKRKIIRFFRRVILVVAIAVLAYKFYGENDEIASNVSNGNVQAKVVEAPEKTEDEPKIVDKLAGVPDEVKNSPDEVIQVLLSKVNDYPEVIKILSNINLYPRELLELAAKKDEVISFVANYPNYNEATNETISIKKDYKNGEIPLFIQWDERWGYDKYGSDFIAINGCGPTSLAMVVVGLTGNTDINPKIIADASLESGYLVEGVGSSWDLMTLGAASFGLIGEELSLREDTILNTLRNGQPIIATMGPGTFTTSGHFIVLTGVDKDNKIIVNDPDSKIKSNQT